jgi:hypothetical protein
MIRNPGSAQYALSVAQYDSLSSSSVIKSLTKGVFDGDAPPTIDYPYIVLGEMTEGSDDLLVRYGMELTTATHIWSRYRGTKESKLIGSEVLKVLNRQSLPCADWYIILAKFEGSNTITEGDEVRHTIVRMRYKMAPLP